MGRYADSPTWADVAPLIQEETAGAAPLAQIAYSDEYSEAMSYLRAVMAADEKSERVLELTEHIIRLNPAHYTVWLYRSATLAALNSDLSHELTTFLNPLSLSHLKNYQIWHHRQTIMGRLADNEFDYDHESAFLQQMFSKDAKNYHVWSYRQWLVRRFALWDDTREWDAVTQLLREDVRNNSVWNHRWYLAFARSDRNQLSDAWVVRKELEFAMAQVDLAPQNASPWNYIRGLVGKAGGEAAVGREEVIEFASKYAALPSSTHGTKSVTASDDTDAATDANTGAVTEASSSGEVKSSHALELLAQIYTEQPEASSPQQRSDAVRLLELLASKYDPIRAPYWRYRIALVNGARRAVAAVS